MTKLSEFKVAAGYVEALRKLRLFRQVYGGPDSPPHRAVITLEHAEPVTLSTSTRASLSRALECEEMTLTAELRALGVTIDLDGPL